MTKDNIRRSIEETRKETPRYSQTVTDFQNETADASVEIADNFLESQKDVINSMQSAWDSVSQSTGVFGGKRAGDNNYWTQGTMGGGMMMPFFFSPQEMTNIYARTIGVMAEAYVASTRMTTYIMFAGLEATRATTTYARQYAKEASRITSNTTRAFVQTTKETVQVQGEEPRGGNSSSDGDSNSSFGSGGAGSEVRSLEYRGGDDRTTTTTTTAIAIAIASEGTTSSSGGETDSPTTTTRSGGTTETTTTTTDIGEKQEKRNKET